MITHISHTLAQQIVNTIKDVCSYDINFINSSGTIIASTNSARIGAFHEIGRKAAVTGTTIEVAESDNFTGTRQGINMPLYHEDRLLAVIGITGSPEKVRKYAFLAQRITSLLIREQELGQYSRHQADKKQFVISSLLHGDTQNPEYLLKCLKEFQIDPDTPKRLILIHTYPAASGQNYTDSVSGSVLSEHQIQNFFKTAGIILYTFRYPGDYLAVADNSGFSALSGTLHNFAKKHADTLAIAVGRSVSLYQLGLSLTTAETACEALVFTSLLLTTSVQKITQFSMISLWKLFSLPYLRKTVKNFPEKPFVSYLRMKRNFCELIFPWKCPWPIPQRNFFSTKILSNIN